MDLKKICGIVIGSLGFMMSAHANEVLLTANKPMQITFRVANKNQGEATVFGEQRTLALSKNVNVPIVLGNYDLAGLVILSIDGHTLPPSVNQFDKPKQCSMTTNKVKATGALEFTLSPHKLSCQTFGGVFG